MGCMQTVVRSEREFMWSPLLGKLGDYDAESCQNDYYNQFPQFQLLPDARKVGLSKLLIRPWALSIRVH